MCIAMPGQIKRIENTVAIVNMMGVEMVINIQLIQEPAVGDYVLIHAGCAIEKVEKDYYQELANIMETYLDGDTTMYSN